MTAVASTSRSYRQAPAPRQSSQAGEKTRDRHKLAEMMVQRETWELGEFTPGEQDSLVAEVEFDVGLQWVLG